MPPWAAMLWARRGRVLVAEARGRCSPARRALAAAAPAGQAGAYDDDLVLPAIGRVHEFRVEAIVTPALLDGARGRPRFEIHHFTTPKSTARGITTLARRDQERRRCATPRAGDDRSAGARARRTQHAERTVIEMKAEQQVRRHVHGRQPRDAEAAHEVAVRVGVTELVGTDREPRHGEVGEVEQEVEQDRGAAAPWRTPRSSSRCSSSPGRRPGEPRASSPVELEHERDVDHHGHEDDRACPPEQREVALEGRRVVVEHPRDPGRSAGCRPCDRSRSRRAPRRSPRAQPSSRRSCRSVPTIS